LNPLLGYEIALLLVVLYALVIVWLWRSHRLGPDRALSLFGPALMIKTRRGRGWLDRVGRFRRFWTVVADIGIALAAIAMGVVIVFLALDAVLVATAPARTTPPVSEALGIPGINPLIPITYGLVALIVGVVLHELMHGIIARSQRIGVKSIGVLWCVIPVGAFVEQDEEEMQKAPLRQRDRVAAAGVLANFALAVLFFVVVLLLVSSAVQPAAPGVGIAAVVPNTPAANVTLQAGDIIMAINGTSVTTDTQLVTLLQNITPGQTVPLTFYSGSNRTVFTRSVTLESTETYSHLPQDANKGFLGVSATFLTPTQLKTIWVAPWSSSAGPFLGTTYWFLLPLAGLEPVQGPTENFFTVSGPLGALGAGNFWILLNFLYYLAWLDLLLGLSNALPLFPLDGGLLFRDFIQSIAHRVRRGWDTKRLERFAGQMTAVASLAVVLLLLWQFVGLRL
jgi:membrane-associated protease RseP (regulator of RpoE activity)